MECLDEETILTFVKGDLPAEKRARAQDHIATCDECRVLVSAVARSSFVDLEEQPKSLDPARLVITATELADSGKGGPPSAPVRPGDVLAGKYVVDGILGAGGMGVVVSARQTQLDRRVAIKFLLPVACEVPGAVARFLREGKAAARITSEHVARVIDTGMLDGGAPYLVMEYLEGADLSALTTEKGRLPWQDAVEYVLQACEAIVEAHSLGIVHRDLKPANLFLTKRADGSPLVKVLDFGISKIEGGSRRDLTTASMLMGSPRYMSPEQMLSAKEVDARTDVWALGVILYELVTGKPLWDADTVHGLSALIATAPAPMLRTEQPEAPPELESAIARCLTKSRDERLGGVADLALALEPVAPPGAKASIERILKVARRERPALASATPAAPAASASKSPALLIGAGVFVLLLVGVAMNVTAIKKPAATSDAPPSPSASVLAAPAPSPSTAPAAPPPASVAVEPPPAVVASSVVLPAKTVPLVTRKLAAPPATTPSATPAPGPSSRALVDRK